VRLPQPPLLLITDASQASRPLSEIVEAALGAGCRWVSLREKRLPDAERLGMLRQLVEIAACYGARVMVHADIAAATLAAGVHVNSPALVRHACATLGSEALIGMSAHSRSDVEQAYEAGADYATLSPVFATASKPGYGPVLGLDGFATAVARTALPVLALGGIDAARVAACVEAGAAGVAVMGEIMRASDPAAATAAIVRALAGDVGHRRSSP
jgi:thiamine-phosphate pyrophosphorylase